MRKYTGQVYLFKLLNFTYCDTKKPHMLSTKYITQQPSILKNIVCQHNRNIFCRISYICMILIVMNTTNIVCAYKLNRNNDCCNKLNQNAIMWYTLNRHVPVTFATKDYDKFAANVCKMDQLNGIVNKKHNFDILRTIMNIVDTIVYQIEILIDIYVVVGNILFTVVTHGTFILISKLNTYSHTPDLFLLYVILNNIDHISVIISIVNTIITIVVQIDHIHITLTIAIANVIMISELDTKGNTDRIIRFELNGNDTVTVAVIHYDKIDTINYYHLNISIINKIDMSTRCISRKARNFVICSIKLDVMVL